MKYVLGVVFYYWLKIDIEIFYQVVVSSSVDIIYFGENVCIKCCEMKVGDWLVFVKDVVVSGKQVVIFILVLL